ncbi:hypothetical protein [Streptomyces sp. NPDC050600]|uniref:hypothetical protein n=1 Tax=Streptomyces sp. NPDC050600 TaxID=3157213 RepID=UPI0034237189
MLFRRAGPQHATGAQLFHVGQADAGQLIQQIGLGGTDGTDCSGVLRASAKAST